MRVVLDRVGYNICCGHCVGAIYTIQLLTNYHHIMCSRHITVSLDVTFVGIHIHYTGRIGSLDVSGIVDGIVSTIAVAGCQQGYGSP